uniref:Uncharacterized protein n=1 Tax=Arundo donax TaxID=35708 RepID=A0A0A9DQE8_ARUDO
MPYCWFLPRIGCKRWLPLAVEGDVEQEGISSVSTECVGPVVIKGLPAVVALTDVVGGMEACDVSAKPVCFCGSFCCNSCCMDGGGGVACDETLVPC